MTGVLVLAHGSRRKETESVLASVVAKVKEKVDVKLIETAFLQFSEQDLEKGLVSLIEQGATEIKVIPYFLFDGVHITEDIPAELEAFKEKHGQINIYLESTLGDDERLAMILADKVVASY